MAPPIPDPIKDALFQAANIGHRFLLTISGGRIGSNLAGMPVIELHTTGRTSGKRRSTLITPPLHDDDQVVLVASKGGDDRDPDWYRNLVANPDIELTIDGTTSPWTARTATGDERAELWTRIVAAASNYAGYERRTSREIPVIVCTPR